MKAKNSTGGAATKSKFHESGITKLRFRFSHKLLPKKIHEAYGNIDVHVWIGPTEAWERHPKPQHNANRGVWECQELEGGRVAACRFVFSDLNEDKQTFGGNPPDPEAAAVLRRVRAHILDSLESAPDVTHVDMHTGGDGQCQFNVSVTDANAEPPFLVDLVFSHNPDDGYYS
jgi:hypothetical protein